MTRSRCTPIGWIVVALVVVALASILAAGIVWLIHQSDLDCRKYDIKMNSGTVISQTFCFSKDSLELKEIRE